MPTAHTTPQPVTPTTATPSQVATLKPVKQTPLSAWPDNGFLIKDYTSTVQTGDDPVTFTVGPREIFEVIADAVDTGKKICIFLVGPCVLDLS